MQAKTTGTDPPQPSNVRLVGRMLALAWEYRRQTARLIGLHSVLTVMALTGLGFIGLGIDVIKDGVSPNPEQAPRWPWGLEPPSDWSAFEKVLLVALLVFGIAASRFYLDRLCRVWTAVLVQDIVRTLRTRVYDKLQRLSFRFFDANASGSIINRVTGDVQGVRMFVDQVLVQVLMMVMSLTFFLIYMLNIHVTLTAVCLASTPLLWLLTGYFSKLVRPAYRRNRELFDDAVLMLSESVRGQHVVKGFSLQQEQIDRFHRANEKLRDQQRWIFWCVSIFMPVIQLIPQVNTFILLLFGGWLYMHNQITLGGGLIVFAGLLAQFSNQVGNIAAVANSMQRSLTGAQRVFEVLDTPVEVASPPNARPLPRAEGHVRFEHVTFGYREEGEPELADIDFDAEPGRCVAILGATGAGKSTLLSLIPRFYDPQRGRVLVDGVDVREYDLDDLRRNIGVVFQESFLFSHTVAQNIAFGHPEASREQIERAAKIAQAHEFIVDLPDGYETVLSEAGGNLSGGQRQRLAIARAILPEPPILLLDDPTASIDPDTEHEILEAMNRAMAGRTTFVVAHRLSTLRRADAVLVLDRGRIIQRGTHDQLMDQAGHYSHAANLQAADDESLRLLGLATEGGR